MARWTRAFVVMALLLAGPAFAADADVSGVWAFRSQGRIVWLLSLPPTPGGGPPRTGVLQRPEHESLSGGEAVSGIQLPVISVPVQVAPGAPGVLRILQPDPSNPGDVTRFEFRQTGPDRAELTIEGASLAPLPFVRVGPDARVDPNLDRPAPPQPDNPEMTRIYDADQAARKANFFSIDWKTVSKADAERRAEVRALIRQGELRSAGDFLHASGVFQHGDTAADFLFAHTLALIALRKGSDEAAWLAAATLDRYLQKIGQPQIYGTQFRVQPDRSFTQEPYDRALVSDELRQLLGVPGQAAQEQQRKAYAAPAKAP